MAAPVYIHQEVIGTGNIVAGTGDIRITYQLDAVADAERRLLRELLEQVRRFWIDDQLQALAPGELILLTKETRPQAVAHPLNSVSAIHDRDRTPIAARHSTVSVYDDCGRALLILGEPGTGKTVTLLDLARALINRVRDSEHFTEPIPVVLPLSTWPDGRDRFLDWVVGQLGNLYSVGRKSALELLQHRRLVLLLDGLDEIRPQQRASCIHAINVFAADPGVPGLVVCCRRQEYRELIAESSDNRLSLNQAIVLEALTLAQIDAHLAAAGQPLAGLRECLPLDPVLSDLARTPLLLNLMSEAYRGIDASVLQHHQGKALVEREQDLFNTYVKRMFEQKTYHAPPYPIEQTLSWLSWLARQTGQRHQTVFLIDKLQPDWLDEIGQRWLYVLISRVLVGVLFGLALALSEWPAKDFTLVDPGRKLALGLLYGVGAGLLIAFVDGFRLRVEAILAGAGYFPFWVLVYGSIWGLAAGYLVGHFEPTSAVAWGLIAGLLFAVRGQQSSYSDDIRTTERLQWVWCGVPFGILKGLGGGLLGALLLLGVYRAPPDLQGNSANTLGFILTVAMVGLVLGALVGFLVGGFQRRTIELHVRPNMGMVRTAANLLLIVPLVISISCLSLMLLAELINEPLTTGLTLGLVLGSLVGLLAALGYGGMDLIRHYTLRTLLSLYGLAPWRFGDFLDYARRLRLLHKVGPGYAFPHEFFRRHFATLDPQVPVVLQRLEDTNHETDI